MRNLIAERRRKIAAVLLALVLGTVQIAMATPNSNTVIRDDIEYYIQTDKSAYNLGEDVEMMYRVTNLRDENVTFNFSHFPVYQFWVEQDGEQIWNAIGSRLPVLLELTLLPGESREFPDDFPPPFIWDMKVNGNFVDPGTYNVIGGLYDGPGKYDYAKVAVSIDIIPEPSTLILFGVGFSQIIRKKY